MNFNKRLLDFAENSNLKTILNAIQKRLIESFIFNGDQHTGFETIEIVHDDDADGYASATIISELLKEFYQVPFVKTKAVLHGETFEQYLTSHFDAPKTRLVFILDHALTPWVAETLKVRRQRGQFYIFIDHHETQERLDSCDYFLHSRDYSTTALAYLLTQWVTRGVDVSVKWVNPSLVELINHNDGWHYGQDHLLDEEAHSLMAVIDVDGCAHTNWRNLLYGSLNKVLDRGKSIYLVKKREIEQIARRNVFFVEHVFEGEHVRAAVALHSERPDKLGTEMLERYGDRIDCAMILSSEGHKDKFKLSLRSTPNHYNVHRIAHLFGGGGNRNAAGAQISPKILSELLSSEKHAF
jgi:oligoribonuclease NrnB/cAMP/cGMP phosphodiesterase (DHH superfamily)